MADKEIKYIVRVANTDLDGFKPASIALTKIKGVGRMLSNFICQAAGVDRDKKAGELSDGEVGKLSDITQDPKRAGAPSWLLNRRKDYETGEDVHLITAELKFVTDNDIKRLKKIKSYRGMRHQARLPLRGQRTASNFRHNKTKKAMQAKAKRKGK